MSREAQAPKNRKIPACIMKNSYSSTPKEDAGAHITAVLKEKSDVPTLLVLSGGSCAQILPHLRIEARTAPLVIAFGDERFTTTKEGNHYAQFRESDFYRELPEENISLVPSLPLPGEDHQSFAKRMNDAYETFLDAYPNAYALGIFGIGEDGHTAGIFPGPEKEFLQTYRRTEEYCIPVVYLQSRYPQRISVTPAFIEDVLDEVVLFATGTNKCENILDYMFNRSFEEYQIPALIPASHPQSILFTDCPSLLTI
jgi:6-phosphogluconolactonase/glucosamine-6-phosphate isomerase/deaminase